MYKSRTENLIDQYNETLNWIDSELEIQTNLISERPEGPNAVTINGLKLLRKHTELNLELLEKYISDNHKVIKNILELIEKYENEENNIARNLQYLKELINYHLNRKDISCGIECIINHIIYNLENIDGEKIKFYNEFKQIICNKLNCKSKRYELKFKNINIEENYDPYDIDTYFKDATIYFKENQINGEEENILETSKFTKNKNEIKWLNNFNLVKEFKNEFGRFPYQKESYKGINIGIWLSHQYQLYKGNAIKNLTKEKIELLESIGVVWDIHEQQWLNNFELLKEFIKEFGRFPKHRESYKGVNIGIWLSYQHQVHKENATGNLTKERIELLESIGIKF